MTTIDGPRIRQLLDVGRTLMSDLDLESVLERVVQAARELTGAPYGGLGVLNASRTEFDGFVAAGIDQPTQELIGDPPKGRGVLGVLIADPRPVRLTDVGEHPQSYGFPAAHPPMRALLGVPISIRGAPWGNMFVAHEDDRRFSEADEESLVILAEWAAHAIDNAQLYETSERRRTELERGVLVLEVTRDLLLSIGASTQLNRVLELIAKRGRALIAARSIVIMLREDDELVVAASAGPTIDIGVLSREHAADVSTEQAPATHELLVSMLHAGEPVGMLAAARGADSDGFTEEDEQLLALFAATAATAVAIAQTAEADRVKSSLLIADAERRRWARELHDETLQGLGALRLMVARTVRRDEGDAAIEADVDEALNAIDSEIQNLRAIISDLRPAALDDLGLLPALETLLERRARDGLEIMHELTLPALDTGDERLDAELENTIYRIVQEGLTNIVKHAGANTVRLTIDSSPEAVRIELADDGVGFNPQIRASGFGLEGIRERVNLIGGTLEIESGSSGTLLRVRLRAASPAAEDG